MSEPVQQPHFAPPTYPPPYNNNQYTQGGHYQQGNPYTQGGHYQQGGQHAQPGGYQQVAGGSVPPVKEGETYDQTFALEKPKYNDWWAGLLFIATFLGFIAVSVLAIRGYALTKGTNGGGIYDGNNSFTLSTNTVILFMFVLCVGFVVSLLYLIAARKFTKQFIYGALIFNIVLGIGTAVYYFVRKYYSAAIVVLIFALFYAFCAWTWRPRIPFATIVLRTVIDAANRYGHVFIASTIGASIALGFAAWFSVTLVGIYVKYYPDPNNPACGVGGGDCSTGKVVGLVVFTVFAGYWISEVIKNVLHTTICGVYGSWYFYYATGMPKKITRGAFRRAMTYSFGSISLGSLIASIVQMLRQFASLAQSESLGDGNIIAFCLFCVIRFLLDILNWLVQFFNHYAYAHIALYGKAYVPAAKDTWRMMKDRGFDALINDLIIDPVLTAGAVFVGYLSLFLAYLYLQFTKPEYNSDGAWTPLILAFSFLIGLQICNIFMVPLKSGVATIFVCMAFNPEVMYNSFPELYSEIVRTYPQVQTAVQV